MKHLQYVAIVLLLMVAVCLIGCQRTTVAPDYTLYTFDTTQGRFIRVGCTLAFNEDKTGFEITYLDTVHLFGPAERTESGYLLTFDNKVYDQATAALSDLTDDQKETVSSETLAEWNAAITRSEQVFCTENYVFSSASVDLIRRVTTNETRNSYTSIEGYYESADNTEQIFLFKDFKVYGNIRDKDGNATFDSKGDPIMADTPNATYVLNQDFIVLTRVDALGKEMTDSEGKPLRIVYLRSGITYPKDLADFVYTDDDYSDMTKELAAELAGKTVGILTKTFYSNLDMTALDFQ